MRLPKEEQCAYNRYMDSLSLKASEIFTLQTEEEFKVREEEKIEITKKLIFKGLDDDFILDTTGLTIDKIQELRNETKK